MTLRQLIARQEAEAVALERQLHHGLLRDAEIARLIDKMCRRHMRERRTLHATGRAPFKQAMAA